MRVFPLATAGLAALLSLPFARPAAADDIPGTSYVSGNWSGAAETGSDGRFLDCYITVGYVNGEQFWIGLYGDDSLTVYLTSPGTTFAPGQSYSAWLMTEVGYPVAGDAYAVDANYIAFTLYGITDAIDYLTQGSYFRLLGVGIDQAFDVRGMGGALAQAHSCLTSQSGALAATAPAPAPTPGKPALGSSGAGGKPVQMSKPVGLAPPPKPPAN